VVSGFREASQRCPGCATVLDAIELRAALVERCPACAGVWIDWFDGNLGSVARQLDDQPGRGGGGQGTLACPRCQRSLVPELVPGPGAHVFWRCPECAGSFVPHASLEELAVAALRQEAAEQRRSLRQRLAAALRELLGWT
jgi:Zn-finger nucleic acid-binding protein